MNDDYFCDLLRRPFGNLTEGEKAELADRIEELKAKLAKAVEALREISSKSMGEGGCYYTNRSNIVRARTTLAELKGGGE